MSMLVSAGFHRLFKSLSFKIYMIFSALYSLLNILIRYNEIMTICNSLDTPPQERYTIDNVVCDSAMTLIFVMAVFIALFIGREYSDGTLRNKLTVGHDRGSVYLANLIVCAAVCVMGLAIAIIISFGLGVPLIGTSLTVSEIFGMILAEITASLAVCALFVLVSMLVSSKAVTAAVLTTSTIAMVIFSNFVDTKLNEPEYYYGGFFLVISDGKPEIEEAEQQKNPNYLTDGERKVYEFLDEFLPYSQLCHIANGSETDLTKTVIYDIIILMAATEAGVLLFGKKDIK